MRANSFAAVLVGTHLAVVALGYQLGREARPARPEASVGQGSDVGSVLRRGVRGGEFREREGERDENQMRGAARRVPAFAGSFTGRVQAVLSEAASLDAGGVLAALRALRHRHAGAEKLLAEQVLLARYAEVDPETALTYVDRLGASDRRLGSLTVMSAWAAADPEAASAYYEAQADDFGILDENQRATAASVAGEWAAQDLNAALTWVENLSPAVQGEAYQRIVAQVLTDDPGKAVALVDSMADGLDRREMLATLASQWTFQNPGASLQWLAALAESDQVTAMPKLVEAWMQTDPLSASQWLAQLPDGAAKDSAILTMTQSATLRRDPEAAVAWSAVIQDPAIRARALETNAALWQRLDPESASQWFGQGGGQ